MRRNNLFFLCITKYYLMNNNLNPIRMKKNSILVLTLVGSFFRKPITSPRCPKCHHPVPFNATLCGYCGFSMGNNTLLSSQRDKSLMEENPVNPTSGFCKMCGAKIQPDQKFCEYCGAYLEK
jgi:predicted amidophosphoribosyltransferase